MNSDLMIGVAGEHLVCFDLITRGFTCFMTEQGLPYDVIADINGKLVKVQVPFSPQYVPGCFRVGSRLPLHKAINKGKAANAAGHQFITGHLQAEYQYVIALLGYVIRDL